MPRSKIIAFVASLQLAACGAHSDDVAPKTVNPTVDSGSVGAASEGDGDAGGATDSGPGPTLITEPDQGMTPVYDFVGTAKKTLDMTMYELTDTTMTGLLLKAAKSGVTVRVILDQNLEMTDNTTAYNALMAGGVQVHWANPTYASSHQKTITVDATTSAIMTLNLSSEDYATSRDFAVITTDAADVAAIESVFGEDFTNAAVTPPNGDNLVWSPTNAQAALVGLISGAKTSLLVENEEMGLDTIVSALVSAAGRGVDVKVVMENSRSYASEFDELIAGGVRLVTYEHAAIYIHAKIILADFGTSSAKVFVGSENFTHASLSENRELGLIISDLPIMTSINATLTSDYSGGTAFQPVDAGAPYGSKPPGAPDASIPGSPPDASDPGAPDASDE